MTDTGSCELSAAVVVFNGMETLARCLDSLSFCDEVVVVDSHSTDGTWEYLQQSPVRAVQNRQTSHAGQREVARDLCRGKWLLTMDADEYVTQELARAIRSSIRRKKHPDGFYLRRRNPFPLGLKGHHWSRHPRLVLRDRCRWQPGGSPHSPLDKRGLRLKRLRGGHLEHEPIQDVPTALRKALNRGLIVAAQSRTDGRRPGAFRLAVSTAARFLKGYFGLGAWRFGRDGFLWASLWAFEAYCKYSLQIPAGENTMLKALDGGPGSQPDTYVTEPADRLSRPL